MKKIFTSMLILSSLFLFACNSDEGRNTIINPVQELPTGRGSIEIVVRRSKVPSASFNVVGSSPSIPADSTGVIVILDPKDYHQENIEIKADFDANGIAILKAQVLTGSYDIKVASIKEDNSKEPATKNFLTYGTVSNIKVLLNKNSDISLNLTKPAISPKTYKIIEEGLNQTKILKNEFYGGEGIKVELDSVDGLSYSIDYYIENSSHFSTSDHSFIQLPKYDKEKIVTYTATYKFSTENETYTYTSEKTYTFKLLPSTGIVIE